MSSACPVCNEPTRDGLTCWTCVRDVRRQLGELPWLHLETRRAALGLVRMSTPGAGRPAETPLPINPKAGQLATRVRAGVIGWVRVAVDRGADLPAARMTTMTALLTDRLRDLRHHAGFPMLARDAHTWTTSMIRTINRPAQRRIEVGPCPLDTTDNDGHTIACTGTVWAIFPTASADTEAAPPHAACSWCCDPDTTPMVGLWQSHEWRTLGRLIERRRDTRAAQLRLVNAIIRPAKTYSA